MIYTIEQMYYFLGKIMNEDQIRDIPSIKGALDDVEGIKKFKKAVSALHPLLKLLDVDIVTMDETLEEIDSLEKSMIQMASLPDRFNNLFATRGWIIYGYMNFDVAKTAVEKAEAGDIDGAEADLVEYYSADTVRWKLQTMRGVKAFRPRMRLAELALTDYQEERYHACIPVVLALLDGLVNELHKNHRGFFAEGVDLTAWDSMAAHSKGLNVLAGILKQGRKTTRTEEIAIPYRHGIMHGMDLGYANKMVAAKTWAALFATRDWALKVEKGELTSPPEKHRMNWRETFRQFKENRDDKSRLAAWQPRAIQPGMDIPETGGANMYGQGTPERKLAEFLSYWKERNYGYMARCVPIDIAYSAKELPAQMRKSYGSKHLKAFRFISISDDAAAVTEIKTALLLEEDGTESDMPQIFRMIYLDTDGNPATRERPGGTWTVFNWGPV